MATAVQTMTPEDQAFIDAWQNQTAGKYAKWGTKLPKLFTYADKLKNIKSFYTDAPKEYKPLAIKLGVEWLKANNPDILDETGNPFKDGFYADIISGDAATQKRNAGTLDAIRTTSATEYVDKTFDAKGTLGAAARAAEITKITQGTKIDPYTPAKLATAVNSVRDTAAYKPRSKTFDQLKATYGGFLDSSGKPVFSDTTLKAVANAQTLGEVANFNTKLNSLADSVLKSQGSSYVSLDPVKKAEAKQALFKDPTSFVTSVNGLNKTNKTNLGTPSTVTGGAGIDTLTPVKSLKTWKAPQQGVATANSPYSGLLDATLAKVTGANFGTPTNNAVYKNLTDPLTQGMGLDSLPKPKLIYDTADTAGITGLGNVKGTLQSLNTQVTSTPTYNSNQIANANTALENAADIAGKVVDPGIVKPLVKTPAELAAEQFALDKASYMNSFTARDYIDPQNRTRSDILTQAKTDPKLAANLDWSAQLDKSPADFTSKVGMTPAEIAAANKIAAEKQAALGATTNNGIVSLTQGTDVVNQNLVPTNTDKTVSNVYGADPNQMTLTQGTDVVNQNLGPLNIPNLGAVISPQAMNSNAGGVASLVSPQVTVQPQPAVNYTYAPSSQQQLEDQAVNAGYQGDYSDTAAMQGYLNSNAGGVASLVSPQVTVQPQPAVVAQKPAVVQQVINPGATQVLDSSGVPIPGRRKMGMAPV